MSMTDNEIVFDEKLSSGEFVTYREIADDLLTDKKNVAEQDRVIGALRQIVRRLRKDNDVLDYKKGKNAREGIRYKTGSEHYLSFLEATQTLKQKKGNEKINYATIGLGLLLKDENTEVTRIEFECVRNLSNAKLVSAFATYILQENVLHFSYVTPQKGLQEVTFHPQYLKEYNNRWAVYGKCEGESRYPTCIRIDSINYGSLSSLSKDDDIKYVKAKRGFYREYFKDFIGFSRKYNAEVENVYITTNDEKVHNLIKTKPFHESQEEIEPWSEEEHHGKFLLKIIPNIELRTKLLAYGAGITLEGNGWFQQEFKNEIKKMAELYSKEES